MLRKPVLMGGGLGLLVLALVAGGFWLNATPPEQARSAGSPVVRVDRAASPADSAASVPPQPVPAVESAASKPPSSQTAQERRRRLADVRAEFNALRAQGLQAPPGRMRAVVDELEALSPPGMDPRYFQTLRSMLEMNARVQVLNSELQTLGKSTSPRDAARQKEILDEMRVLGERVGVEARKLRSYAPVLPPRVKTP